MKAGRSRAGVTLVELLTVIAVLGVLAGLIWAGMGKVRESADRTQCQSRLRALGVAGLLSIADQRGEMPDAMYWWQFPENVTGGSVLPYLDYREGMENAAGDSPMACPASLREVGPNEQWNRGYSINIYACRSESGQRVSPYNRHASRLTQIKNPAEMAFFMDGNFLSSGVPERKVGTASVEMPWDAAAKTGFFLHPNGRVNVVHLDGHVSARALNELPMGSWEERRRAPFWGSLE